MFAAILKRGVIGAYHHWSAAHMHRYLAEFDFRYSHKEITDAERSDETYRRTAALAAQLFSRVFEDRRTA